MSFDHTLALGSLLKNIGVKGGQIPLINDALVPVLVVGSVETLDASPVEARGLVGHVVAPPITNRGAFRLSAVGRALIVQDVYTSLIGVTGKVAADWNLFVGIQQGGPFTGGATSSVTKIDVGGLAATGLCSASVNAGAVPGTGFTNMVGDLTFPGQRWFVPAGHSLTVTTKNVGESFGLQLIWRELPAPIGAP